MINLYQRVFDDVSFHLQFGKMWNVLGSSELTIKLILLLAALYSFNVWKNYRKLPPGPWGLPVIGYLAYSWVQNTHYQYVELTKKYGKIFSIKMGQRNIVVMADAKMVKEAFNKEEFSGRPNNELIKLLGGYGIINTEGHMWRDQRRFLHTCLRWFGMTFFNKENNKRLQTRIMGEVETMLKNLKKESVKPFDPNQCFMIAISNVICSMLMSVRFTLNDTLFKNMMFNMEEGFRLFGGVTTIVYFPILKFCPWFVKEYKKISKNKDATHNFFQRIIDDHKKTFDETKTRDVLDCYLLEIKKAQRSGTSDTLFDGKDHNSQMRQIVVDLFTAGMETTKTTLHWTMIYMLHYPELAKIVQSELDEVVGRKRLPTYDDIPYLPNTEATVFEVMRMSSVVPLGNSHATTRDVLFKGYKIPKDTEIVPLIYAINNDPTLWDEPQKFNPNRFLNSEGRVFKPDYFIPFGIGRRNCLCELLARMEIFMFVSAVLHTFDIELPQGEPLPSLEGNFGITLNPSSYKIVLVERPLEGDIQRKLSSIIDDEENLL